MNELCKERMYYAGKELPKNGEGFGGLLQDGFYINYLHGIDFICRKYINKKTRVLELGCFNGVSSELFSEYTDYLTCVDIELYPEMQKVLDRTNIKFCKDNAIEFLEKMNYDQYDFIYIDDDHSYSHIKKEILLTFQKLKINSYISGHDYNTKGVQESILDSFIYPEIEIYLDSSWVIQKNDRLILKQDLQNNEW